jgi:diaminopimelate epimerase
MLISFQKMHGTMNDFVVFHDPVGRIELSAEQVVRVCNRRLGVGADGIIVIRPSNNADFFMDYVNSDGSSAEMCGNGIRCMAKYAYDSGLTDKTTLAIETRAGIKVLEIFTGADGKVNRVQVNMGSPLFHPKDIPTIIDSGHVPIVDYPIEVQGQAFLASMVSMGNPHCVIVVDGEIGPLPKLYGASIETHPLFPAKTNVEFVRVVDRRVLLMRVWERGSGETFSCGTGACAAAVTTTLKGLTDSQVIVQLVGGDLTIAWKGDNADVFMIGPATTVYNGNITI